LNVTKISEKCWQLTTVRASLLSEKKAGSIAYKFKTPKYAPYMKVTQILSLTTVRASLLSEKKAGSIAWKDSSARPVRPVIT
jgi:hypothetical protein